MHFFTLDCADCVRSGPLSSYFLFPDESVRQTSRGRFKIGTIGETGGAARLLYVFFANWKKTKLIPMPICKYLKLAQLRFWNFGHSFGKNDRDVNHVEHNKTY